MTRTSQTRKEHDCEPKGRERQFSNCERATHAFKTFLTFHCLIVKQLKVDFWEQSTRGIALIPRNYLY